ncbi:MAG: hypothetical protein JXN60_01570 [Lentisphaerae bacterium]|nr:hypothetical protein [Lentisphaerota bacterium]
MKLSLVADLPFYLSLSADGKRLLGYFRKLLIADCNSDARKGMRMLIERMLRRNKRMWFRHIRSSDHAFQKFIPRWYITQCSLTERQIYYRFMKIAVLLLFEHVSFLKAFGISVNAAAAERCAVFAFLKRTYDDLLDEKRFVPDVLSAGTNHETNNEDPDCLLLDHLRGVIHSLAPQADFPNYYRLLEDVHIAQSTPVDPHSVKDAIFRKSLMSFLMDMYVMINDLPHELIAALEVSSQFFACMDDYYDYQQDLIGKKPTYINQSADPKQLLLRHYDELEEYLRHHAGDSEVYLLGLKDILDIVIYAREHEMRKLSVLV